MRWQYKIVRLPPHVYRGTIVLFAGMIVDWPAQALLQASQLELVTKVLRFGILIISQDDM